MARIQADFVELFSGEEPTLFQVESCRRSMSFHGTDDTGAI